VSIRVKRLLPRTSGPYNWVKCVPRAAGGLCAENFSGAEKRKPILQATILVALLMRLLLSLPVSLPISLPVSLYVSLYVFYTSYRGLDKKV